MPDYREMYFILFRAHSKVLKILEQATLKTEQMSMEDDEPIAFSSSEQNTEDD